jgi:hypothetical protein
MANDEFNKRLREAERLISKLTAAGKKPFINNEQFKQLGDDLEFADEVLSDLRDTFAKVNDEVEDAAERIKNIADDLDGGVNHAKNMDKAFKSIEKLSDKIVSHKRDEQRLTVKQLKDVQKQLVIKRKLYQESMAAAKKELQAVKDIKKGEEGQLIATKRLSKEHQKLLDQYNEANDQLTKSGKDIERINKASKELLATEMKINKTLGVTGAAFKGIKNTLGKIGIESEHFEKMDEDMRTAAKSGSRLKVAFAGIKGVLGGISEALNDPIVLVGVLTKAFKFMYGIMNDHYKQIATVGNMYGVTGAQAENMVSQIKGMSQAGGDFQYTFDEIVKSQGIMNQAAGQNLKINKENAQFMSMLVDDMGVSEQAAGKLFKLSLQTGKGFEEISDQVLAMNVDLNRATGTSMDFNAVMEQIGGMSDTMLVNFQGNTKAMIQAAHTAQRLGMTMDQIANASRQTLDFESSIQKEIEAEMFLQKDLNLEKLRQATLAGDAKTQAAEQERLVRENFAATKGNVLMQEKMASVLGLSHEEYMKIGNRLEHEQKIGKEGVATEKKKARELAEQAQKQDEVNKAFEAAIFQLKEALLPIVERLGPIFTGFAKMVGTFFASPAGKLIAQVGGLAVGGALVFKAGKSILSLFGLGGKKPTGTAMDPIHTVGGGGGSGITDMLGMGSRWTKSMKMFKGVSKLFGGKSTMMGRGMRNLAAMFGKRSSFTNQIVKNSKFLSKLVPSMSKLTSKIPAVASGTAKAGGGAMGFLSKAGKGVGGFLKTAGKALGPIAAVGDMVLGGFTGASQADMSAEEQKAAGVEVGIGKGKATALGVLTGGAEKGSIMSGALGIEKGSAADEAMGIAGAGARGAAIGATIGSVIPVVGTAVGAVVGGAVGMVSEGVKVFSDPNSALRKKVAAFGTSVKEGAGKAFDFLKEKGGQAWEGLKKGAGAWWKFQKKGFSKMWDFAKKGFSALKKGASKVWGGVKSAAKSIASGVKNVASKAWSGVKSGAKAIGSFFGLKDGGIAHGGFRAFANGGVVNKPTVGLIGEGSMNEAVVPLPDGKNIPVNMNTQKLESLLQQLVNLTAKGSTVVMDGAIVGQKIASSTSELGS